MLNARRIPLARGKLHRGHPPITTYPMGGDVCGGLPLLTKNYSRGGGQGVEYDVIQLFSGYEPHIKTKIAASQVRFFSQNYRSSVLLL